MYKKKKKNFSIYGENDTYFYLILIFYILIQIRSKNGRSQNNALLGTANGKYLASRNEN